MKRLFLIFAINVSFFAITLGQEQGGGTGIVTKVVKGVYNDVVDVPNTAPTKWDRYTIKEKKLSLLFPKLPVRVDSSDNCLNIDTSSFAAYADGIAYYFAFVSKSDSKISKSCDFKKEFDATTFETSLNEFRAAIKGEFTETKVNFGGNEMVHFVVGQRNTWFLNDFRNTIWYEFRTSESDQTTNHVNAFVESLVVGNKSNGVEIQRGSTVSLGDEVDSNAKFPDVTTTKDKDVVKIEKPLSIWLQPKPPYTDVARKAQTNGVVRLKVVFKANGSIGSISVVSGLENGLTEQAISASRRIVFVPASTNGVRHSVVKIIEYRFIIY